MLVCKLCAVKFEIFLIISFILKLFDILCFVKELGSINCAFVSIQTLTKEVNTVLEIVSVWLVVRYILGISQYRCTVICIAMSITNTPKRNKNIDFGIKF